LSPQLRAVRRAALRAARTAIAYAAYPRAAAGAARHRADFDQVERYGCFLGYPRSGHTLPGALLNAHPQAVVAHELDALQYVDLGFSRDQIFSLLLDRDRWFCRRRCVWTGYSYAVPNQWQGRYTALRLIGDKKGAATARRLGERPALLDRLRRTVRVPIRLIHMTRNPFDNIATMAARDARTIETAAARYFTLCASAARAIEGCDPSEVLHVRHEDLVAHPAAALARIAAFVGLAPSAGYLDDCASIVVRAPSRSRAAAGYTADQRALVQAGLERFSFLTGYSFDD
jgi:hypothetical protein